MADYFAMWFDERAGRPVNKTEHRRLLQPLLQDRTDGAIELKHQNISAILLELGIPFIDGYKPARNYQRLLADVVEARVASDVAIRGSIIEELARPVQVPEETRTVLSLVDTPTALARRRRVREPQYAPTRSVRGVNYLELEARHGDLGRAGEELVLRYERAWLASHGMESLADKVEHVSVTQGDGLGFDVLSFDTDGRERWLEVKTTRYGRYTPFFATRREVDVSHRNPERYRLCRVFNFASQPQFYQVSGSIRRGFDLDPAQYIARIA